MPNRSLLVTALLTLWLALFALANLQVCDAHDIVNIQVSNDQFSPRLASAYVGSIIIWSWVERGNHSVTHVSSAESCEPAASAKFNTGPKVRQGNVFKYTVQSADIGTIYYTSLPQCAAGMRGTLLISLPAETPPPTAKPAPPRPPSPCFRAAVTCRKSFESCQAAPPRLPNGTWMACPEDMWCTATSSTNTLCFMRPTINETCNQASVACYHREYDLSCLDSLYCGGKNFAGAGEQCTLTSDKFQGNGGCFGNTTCTASEAGEFRCLPSLEEGQPCMTVGQRHTSDEEGFSREDAEDLKDGWADQCGPGLFCPAAENSVCTARAPLGRPCTTDRSCRIDLHCRQRDNVCAQYFAAGIGSSCDSILDCRPGLFCARHGACTAVPEPGKICNSTLGLPNDCPEGLRCTCAGYPTTASQAASELCLPTCTLTELEMKAAQDLLLCARKANCQGTLHPPHVGAFELSYYPGSCLERACADKYYLGHQALHKCFQDNTDGYMKQPCDYASNGSSPKNTGLSVILLSLLSLACIFVAL